MVSNKEDIIKEMLQKDIYKLLVDFKKISQNLK